MTRPLTNQELFVLYYLDLGLDNATIAECLDLQKNTVKVHKFNLYKKLKLNGLGKVQAAKELHEYCVENPDLFEDLFPKFEVDDANTAG
jgi:DNA-binding NarL/FixJ family response regulator